MNNPEHISESLKIIFGSKYLTFDAGPGSGMEKNSDPGSGDGKKTLDKKLDPDPH
jgi:hypothetical protein